MEIQVGHSMGIWINNKISETTNLLEPKQCMHNQMSDTGSVEPLVLTIKDKILLLVYVSKANLFDTLDCTVFNIHNMTNDFL